MKNIISYFIKYPVAVNVLIIATIFLGLGGVFKMKSSIFPLLPTSLITVEIAYPGASPEEIEEGVVLKIEDNLRGLVGIKRVTSISSENTAVITVEIERDYEVNALLAEVKNAVDRVPSFPADMEPPIIAKLEAITQGLNLVISGERIPLTTLKQISRTVENDLRGFGVTQISVAGFPQEEIEIAVREVDLRAFDLTFDEVAVAVANANILTTGGSIKTVTEDYLIRANNRSYFGEGLESIVVKASQDGNVVRLHEIATVRDRWSEVPDRLYFNGKSAIEMIVSTTNNEDFLEVIQSVKDYIEQFNSDNANVRIEISSDYSFTLKERIQILLENGSLGIMLVLLLLSIFLKPSLAFWVAIGLPISFLGMFMLVPGLITINIMSLFGMIIVIGILVDDGIVIGENIYHHYELGKNPIRAAIDGTLEVMPAIVSAILTTVVAFSTLFFIKANIGDFYFETSIVVVLTLLFSLIEALIILPSHIAHSRAMNKKKKGFLINRWASKGIMWIRDNTYIPTLRFLIHNPLMGLAIPLAMIILTFASIRGGIIGVTYFPQITSDEVLIQLEMPQGTSEMITDSIISQIEVAAWRANEELTMEQTGNEPVIQNIIKRIGPGSSQATLTLNLLPGESRDLAAFEIANAVENETDPIYGYESLIFGANTSFFGLPVSISLVGNNINDIKGAKEELKIALAELGTLKDISDNDPEGIKEIKLKLKDNAYLLDLTLNEVMRQVRSGFFGRSVQRFQRGRDEIRVWVRYDKTERESIKNLDDMWIVTPGRSRVPLSEIAEYSIERGNVSINHLDGAREIKVEADLKDKKDSATDMVARVRDEIMPEILAKYPTIVPIYEGQNREAQEVSESMSNVVPIILLIMYMIIAFTFRSYSQPLMLFLLIPFSLVGVAWGHWVHDTQISILSLLGVIALIGILVNDGLVLVGKFNRFLREGQTFDRALIEAGRSRFRAIFLTSITTIAGLAPLIIETRRSAQFLIPMAITIAYGILMGTFLTLVLLPVFLRINNSIKRGKAWLFTGELPSADDVERVNIEEKLKEQATEAF